MYYFLLLKFLSNICFQDTRKPFLHLSNLEEGHYQFILRVTDSIGQSSNTSVYVYVQKPSLAAPKGMFMTEIIYWLSNLPVELNQHI